MLDVIRAVTKAYVIALLLLFKTMIEVPDVTDLVLLMVLGVIDPCFVLVLNVNEPNYYLLFLML